MQRTLVIDCDLTAQARRVGGDCRTLESSDDVRRLYQDYGETIRGLARRLLGPDGDIDDLVHDVFVVAWRKRAQLSRRSARAFLFSIALKLASDMRRKKRLWRFLGLESAPPAVDWRTPEQDAERRDAQRMVSSILDLLPEKRRAVFVLHELQGLTAEEIGEVLGCPMNTVFTRLYKARSEFEAEVLRRYGAAARGEGEGAP